MTKPLNERLVDMQKFGFWVRTKQAPYRAVRWDAPLREDGKRSFHGRNWVEILPHGADRDPERFFGADVEPVGPSERLSYYPAVSEPVCGWQEAEWRDPGEFCPRVRERGPDGALEAFCRLHNHILQGEERHA